MGHSWCAIVLPCGLRGIGLFERVLDGLRHRHRLPLSPLGVETVVITGVSTENCCHATARDALFRDYRVVLLSSATATFDYPDVGQEGRAAAEVHRATPVILVGSTAHVMTAEEFMARTTIDHHQAAVAG